MALALTAVAMAVPALLPERRLELTSPAFDADFELNHPALPEPERKFMWLDRKQHRMRCAVDTAPDPVWCGVRVMLQQRGPDGQRKTDLGMDLSTFDDLELDLEVAGAQEAVRAVVRNFDPRFSKVDDHNSPRPHTVNLRNENIGHKVRVPLTALTVPEWWIGMYDLPLEFNAPGMDNVVVVSLDFAGDVRGKQLDLHVRSCALVGKWIAPGRMYLYILLTWMALAALHVARELQRARRANRLLTVQSRKLSDEQQQLQLLATTDTLTGVLNRRGLGQVLADLQDRGLTVALILVDIDHFKHVNDRFGHDAGDGVLRDVSAVLKQQLRRDDVIGRWGGEEFLVVCQSRSIETAASVAELLRHRIESHPFQVHEEQIPITASLGVSLLAAGAEGGFASAFQRADAALYRAKRTGRNRVVVEGDEGPAGVQP